MAKHLHFVESPCGLAVKAVDYETQQTKEVAFLRTEDGYSPKQRQALEEAMERVESYAYHNGRRDR